MNMLPPHLHHLQHLQGEELKAAIQQEYCVQAVAFIIRQTEYDEKTAIERLQHLKDPVKVVKEYLGINPDSVKETNNAQSKNQIKYGEIRKFMDAGAKQYNMQMERRKYLEKLQQQQEQQQQEQQEQQQQEQQEQQEQQQQEQQEQQEPQ